MILPKFGDSINKIEACVTLGKLFYVVVVSEVHSLHYPQNRVRPIQEPGWIVKGYKYT